MCAVFLIRNSGTDVAIVEVAEYANWTYPLLYLY
jgi:hypothetical protein